MMQQLLITIILGCTLILLFLSPQSTALAKSLSRVVDSDSPNIILMVADDLGYGDLSVTGAPDIQTPNIDRLAQEGILFTHAYANAPVCTPTRASILTGQYQQRTGLDRVIFVTERNLGLSDETVLLPELLRDAGYVTGMFGKWHLGYTEEAFPTNQGFEQFVGFVAGNVDYFTHEDRIGNPDLWRNKEQFVDNRYATDLIVDEAIQFVDQHQESPFFAYIPFTAPHSPFQSPEDNHTAGYAYELDESHRTRDVYRSMVESMDMNIGRLLTYLDEENLNDDTVVIFLSDNGGELDIARNLPFQGVKGQLWEGGIRVPLLVRWTNHIPAGQVSEMPVVSMDLFATVLEIAGVAPDPDQIVDGLSLYNVLMNASYQLPRDTIYFRYYQQEAMLQNGWKYLLDADGEAYLFFEDDLEQNNLAEIEAARLGKMRRDYDQWYAGLQNVSSHLLSERLSRRETVIRVAIIMGIIIVFASGYATIRRLRCV
ncbi:MAG: sulfatase [Chloroflexi bacterium]|nr:sulfatase [Chloroflexota bacterium]